MRGQLKTYLLKECDKQIARYMAKLRAAALDRERYERRTGGSAGIPKTTVPSHWTLDQQFNPFYVRSHIDSLSFTLAKQLRAETYQPKPCLRVQVPKPTGGTRGISIFTVVDAAISTWLYDNLLKRNVPEFSNYAYAYRVDRNAQHAIDYIAKALVSKKRAYVLEYDFTKYFDSVRHDYLLRVISGCCKVSPREQAAIQSFLRWTFADGIGNYRQGGFQSSCVGFPQGATISLFLANMACFELDRDIERTGAIFARYADDTIILCDDYATAHQLAGIMLEHGTRSGAAINTAKSPGISLVADPSRAEVKAKGSFTFLGHEISAAGVCPSARTIFRLKRKLSLIIYQHLLYYPKRGQFNPKRVSSSMDWDLVTCLNELRRHLYGNVPGEYLEGALAKKRPLKLSVGALTYFQHVNSPAIFAKLDGWLIDVLIRAHRKRVQLLGAMGVSVPCVSKQQLLNGTWYKNVLPNERIAPSTMKAWRYTRKCSRAYGVRVFSAPPPYNW
jgi:RNA-directed DNA polymerase